MCLFARPLESELLWCSSGGVLLRLACTARGRWCFRKRFPTKLQSKSSHRFTVCAFTVRDRLPPFVTRNSMFFGGSIRYPTRLVALTTWSNRVLSKGWVAKKCWSSLSISRCIGKAGTSKTQKAQDLLPRKHDSRTFSCSRWRLPQGWPVSRGRPSNTAPTHVCKAVRASWPWMVLSPNSIQKGLAGKHQWPALYPVRRLALNVLTNGVTRWDACDDMN